MAEIEQEKDRKRSPNYPSISLPLAVVKISKLYPKVGINAATKEVLAGAWETTPKSSSFLQAIGSLGKYGLISAIEGTPRKFKLTKDALDVVMLPASDARHLAALKRAALAPKLFKNLWETHGADIVSDGDLNHVLVTEHEFRPDAAVDAVKQYRRTIEFAKLQSVDKIDEEEERPAVKVGDFVQWESQGALRLSEPKRVATITEDGNFVTVEGSNTGLPITEVYKVDPPEKDTDMVGASDNIAGGPKNPPPSPPPSTGIKQYTYTVDTGDAVVRWPAVLSDEDCKGIEMWLEGLKAKIKRSVQA